VYFVTQSPSDIPETILGQLGNRVQHALRAFTPHDQKAVKVAADTLRPNPKIDTARAITELAVGEALVSVLDEKGAPTVTERAWIVPPASQIGPIPDADREAIRKKSVAIYGNYEHVIDRESAYEKLKARTIERTEGAQTAGRAERAGGTAGAGGSPPTQQAGGALTDILFGSTGPRGGHREGLVEAAAKSVARSLGSGVGRAILRGTLGSILGSGSRR